jgi:hypothetical protein
MSEYDTKNIESFWHSIEGLSEAYTENSSFSYFAVRDNDRFILTSARILLTANRSQFSREPFASRHMRAGNLSLRSLSITPKELMAQLMSGSVQLPDLKLAFPPQREDEYSTYFVPLHEEGRQAGNRLTVLAVSGASRLNTIDTALLDWELKAAETPYDSVVELLGAYGLGQMEGTYTKVEFIAFHVAAVDYKSSVIGEIGRPRLLLAKGLDKQHAALGYRLFSGGVVTKRARIPASEMEWEDRSDVCAGVSQVDIPPGGVLHCYASYAGVTQHQAWLSDPSTFQNPRRAILETFDPGLTILRDSLLKAGAKKRDARDLETAVAWLLWMLGFSPSQLGLTERTQEAPDTVACTPKGNLLVVECTTGLLKADNKLANLIDRTAAVRRQLDSSGNRHLRVLPVIVTSKTALEVRADEDQAHRLGIAIATRDMFEPAIARTLVEPNADLLFSEVERVTLETQQRLVRTEQAPS